jgi:O-acetyl-ADP-ribose deacetylase (regulator of RNase III)
MITIRENADIFGSTADALVNPVNCRGVMGKGLALQFKTRFPECFGPYKEACDAGLLRPGILVRVPSTYGPDIIMFPTKDHWREPSRLEWIEQGLAYLKAHYSEWGIRSLAMPKIGCGLGGLDWRDVRPLIEKYLADEPLQVEVYV